ncbi:Peroxiredoxin-5, mitochondrial [Triplophysa tibetana]|uniref:Peroxiredoxin-5 n=1 Tax=Triplophysa tibetana TaxID=1572043 RepID=A0A5A9PGT0_9TELE|nr:Peroxiredoxin-5, mitochondrial [Triplophysa tibetana]
MISSALLQKGIRATHCFRLIHSTRIANMPIQTHLPGFIEMAGQLRAKGVQEVACLSVNDVFVISAWGNHHGANGKVRMLADPTGAFTQAVDLALKNDQLIKVLGKLRSQRYAMLIEDGVVKKLSVEPDGTGLTCSLASNFLSEI